MNYIGGQWRSGCGAKFESTNPATESSVWNGHESTQTDVEAAVGAARESFEAWSHLELETRIDHLNRFAGLVAEHQSQLAQLISDEVGKPKWDATGEVLAMSGKISVSVEAMRHRRAGSAVEIGDMQGATRYAPHGVLCVFGPFNFPGHIANGLIVPALLAGNTIVFKPSELTPAVAELTVKLWEQAGLPPGVINLLQGGRDTGASLVAHPDHNGVLFTGSLPTAVAIRRALVDRPECLVVLELGGNNPLVVHNVQDIDAAVYWTIQSAFITSGQRCTCARRLIVTDGNQAFLRRLVEVCETLVVGAADDEPEPFCGPLVHASAATNVLEEQQRLADNGAEVIIAANRLPQGAAFVSPGLIDVTNCTACEDKEVFGPLLQLVRVRDLDAAIIESNETRYGLVASLLGASRAEFDVFRSQVRAGLINWNRPTTGASGRLPFGGLGASGNHRPAGYFAADFCSAPVSSLESQQLALPKQRTPGVCLP